jgi:hypothetical protein
MAKLYHAMMLRALKWPRPVVYGRHARIFRKPKATGFRSAAVGSIRRCADGWQACVRQDFMLQDFMLEALPLC